MAAKLVAKVVVTVGKLLFISCGKLPPSVYITTMYNAHAVVFSFYFPLSRYMTTKTMAMQCSVSNLRPLVINYMCGIG